MMSILREPDLSGVPEKIERHNDERGYALVALIALITVMMLLVISAAPNIRQQTQREREIEAIFRGEEVAEAIRRYVQANNGQLPTSMDQLLEGVSRGTKKVQILRPAAAKDPLSESGEWRLIRLNDPALIKFQVAVTNYAGGREPLTRDPFIQRYKGSLKVTLNLDSKDEATPGEGDKESSGESLDDDDDEESGGEDTSVDSTGPFIGVASRNRSNSIISYYGVERYNRWVFTPLFR
jgi:type II secretory pathway pseudopilin PulG